MWVVKLGGSLLGTPELKQWLTMLADKSDGRIIIVPGGGVFADTVREQQVFGQYDDAAAHTMAVLAMEQFGSVLQSLQPDLVAASTELEIAECSWQHRAIVWRPHRMIFTDDEIPQNWSVTSDSLAAWLAQKIGADRLVIVKHQPVPEQPLPLQRLQEQGIVDGAFTQFAQHLTCPLHIFGKTEHPAFARMWNEGKTPALAD
ncbi:MAG: uridylate kinase [Methylobacillus sp.]|jgi:aspartokinase-like uncharacterized kinase|nr:uridylate kinase [Methylobacillus sp.]